jgi:hypothetical protein
MTPGQMPACRIPCEQPRVPGKTPTCREGGQPAGESYVVGSFPALGHSWQNPRLGRELTAKRMRRQGVTVQNEGGADK